jgi:calcineurin-like phosphoesterase family protein
MAIYACSDFHGNYAAYEAVKNYIGENDVVYYLGDAGDRGPRPWETIVAIYNDSQFVYIKGNHEDMLVNAMKEWLPDHVKGVEYELLAWNGGHKTFQEWKDGPERNKWVTRLSALPTYEIYVNANNQVIHLTHAGFTPPTVPKYDLLIWDRDHIYDDWAGIETEYVVHGHTPTRRYVGADEICTYCNDHKIDIDISCYRSQKVALLNLDTFEPVYLSTKNEEDEVNG